MRPLAVVTGASAGLGKEFALQLAAAGYDLVLVARREAELHALAAEVAKSHAAAHVLALDLGAADGPKRLCEALAAQGLHPDALVNNAGFGWLGEFADADPANTLAMIQLNVAALVDLTARLLPGMKARGRGKILNVASTAAFQPGPYMAVYYATKAFVLSFSEALHAELGGTGVTVTCLCPGPTKTEFAEVSGMNRTRLFDGGGVMTAEAVARDGVRGLQRGRRLVVSGFANRLMTFAVRFLPRAAILHIVKRIQRTRTGEPRA